MTKQTAKENIKELNKIMDKKLAEGLTKKELQPVIDDMKILKEIAKTEQKKAEETPVVENQEVVKEEMKENKEIKSSLQAIEYHKQRYIKMNLREEDLI